jgi:hypothetical protein
VLRGEAHQRVNDLRSLNSVALGRVPSGKPLTVILPGKTRRLSGRRCGDAGTVHREDQPAKRDLTVSVTTAPLALAAIRRAGTGQQRPLRRSGVPAELEVLAGTVEQRRNQSRSTPVHRRILSIGGGAVQAERLSVDGGAVDIGLLEVGAAAV